VNVNLAFFLAWRSLGRNPRRSIVSVAAISLGLSLCMLMIAFADGVYQRTINNAVAEQAGHLVLQHPNYTLQPGVDLAVNLSTADMQAIKQLSSIDNVHTLVLANTLVRSSYSARNGSIYGVDPNQGLNSIIAKKVNQGRYLDNSNPQQIVISDKLARHLKTKLKQRLVLVSNDAHGNTVEALFSIVGIFPQSVDGIDSHIVHMPLIAAQAMLGLEPQQFTRVGILLQDPSDMSNVQAQLQWLDLPQRGLLTWQQVLPALADYIRTDRFSMLVFNGLFVLLVLATIFNTILMSVLERRHEFSTIMALGTPPSLLRLQVLIEGILLALLGCGLGTVLGLLMIWPLYHFGIDMSALFPDGISTSGVSIDTQVYGYISLSSTVNLITGVFIATCSMTLWPIYKATRIPLTQGNSA